MSTAAAVVDTEDYDDDEDCVCSQDDYHMPVLVCRAKNMLCYLLLRAASASLASPLALLFLPLCLLFLFLSLSLLLLVSPLPFLPLLRTYHHDRPLSCPSESSSFSPYMINHQSLPLCLPPCWLLAVLCAVLGRREA